MKSYPLFGPPALQFADGSLPAASTAPPPAEKIEISTGGMEHFKTPPGLPARPANHPDECAYCQKTKAEVGRLPYAGEAETTRWIADLEHTVRRLAAVAGEKGARPPDMTLRENRVISTCMKLEPDDGYKP